MNFKLIIATVALSGAGLVALGADVASAHANSVSGKSTCLANGTYKVDWTVGNDFNLAETVTLNTFSGGGTLTGLPADIAASPMPYDNAALVYQTAIPGTATSASLTVNGVWSDTVTSTNSNSVTLGGNCKVQVVTGSVTFTDPTCANPTVSVNIPTTTGVTYTTTGTVAPGGSVTVTATAKPGFVLTGTTNWQHTFPAVPDCRTVATSVAPVVTTTMVCAALDSFTAGPTTGVVYTPSSGTLAAGQVVDVIATPATGFKFASAQTVTYPLTGGTVEACPSTPTIATSVAPVVTTSTVCATPASYSAGPTTGVLYTPSSGSLAAGQVVTVVATPTAGYTFNGAQSVSYTVTGGRIETCATTAPVAAEAPATAPTTTTAPIAAEAPAAAPTTTVVLTAVAPPPVGPSTPTLSVPALTNLPTTGTSTSIEIALGLALLLFGTTALRSVRRRPS